MNSETSSPLSAQLQLRPDSRLKHQLRWIIGIRLVAISSIMLPFLLAPEQAIYDYLLQGTGAVYLASLAYLVMHVRNRPSLTVQAYIQFAGDLLFITGLVYSSGGIASPISILYLIVITVASVLSQRRVGIIVASVAWLLYAVVVLGLFYGWIGTAGVRESDSVVRLVYHLAIHLFGFYAVALLTSQLAHNVARAEQALEIKRELLADLQIAHHDVLESVPSGLLTTDLDGRVISANAAAHQILGKEPWGLVGTPLSDVGFFSQTDWEALKRGDKPDDKRRLEAQFLIGDNTLQIGFSISPLRRADGTTAGDLVIFQDLSEWRKLQEELRRADRMAAVGTMASGLAHEIGNPLAAISGSVQMLSAAVPANSSQGKLLGIIFKESERLDRTIKGFLQFARPFRSTRVSFDVAALLSENVELLRNSSEVGDDHRIDLDLHPSEVRISGDPDQVSQIFWNLARNALRAMDSGGTLRIAGHLDNGTYRMSFSDTGRGMQEEERANLFHPFRSFFDGGSGIGMAIVYRIVEEHGGHVHVDSIPEHGTTITIDLPAAESVTPLLSAEA
ncbi:MAG: ATP-binding protein [Acidobacteriota bacterium]|nr:ATP-binding protein [Acidobacteriota bacterium]